ncbi:MAG: mandelate racemase/muconate lactonizing enzyme family protein [Alphaproteobacteria bacterium]
MKIVETKIHTIPVNHRGNWVLVEVTAADGRSGWGEASDSRDETACIAEIERIGRRLAGREIAPLDAAAGLMKGIAAEDRLARTPPSAVAQALYDLAARQKGMPVAGMLAGNATVRSTVPVYANVNRMCASRDAATIAAAGKQVIDAGITKVKFAPFDEVSPGALASDGARVVEPGVARLRALRDAIGGAADLMIDCHWRFTHATGPLLAEIAKSLDIRWIEDPFETWDRAAADRLRKLSGARVTGGEDLYTCEALEKLIASGCIDVAIADVKFVGGTGELDRMCKMAARHGVAFAPHNPSGPLCTAASAHVVAANPNAEILEFPYGEVSWRTRLAQGERLLGGVLQVSGPGYGIDIRPDRAGAPVLAEA